MSTASGEEILSKTLPTVPGLEGKDTALGVLIFERNSKYLLGSRKCKAVDSGLGKDDLSNNEVAIKRGTIALACSKFGTSTAAIMLFSLPRFQYY